MSKKFIIEGGNRLFGELKVQGSKNSSLPILAATLLTDEECVIHNCPNISDVKAALEILKTLGCNTEYKDGTVKVKVVNDDMTCIPEYLMKTMRSSVMFLGSLLAKRRSAEICRPGGCRLGERPIDIHLNALTKLGVSVKEYKNCILCSVGSIAERDITLLYPSVGATENIMLACAGSGVKIRIYNPAREPEIVELQNFLNLMGAKISGASSDVIVIEATKGLHGCEYTLMSDRIVASTYACMTAACGGDVVLKDADSNRIKPIIEALRTIGCIVTERENEIEIISDGKNYGLDNIKALPYPSFPTDVQPILAATLCSAKGESKIIDAVFENRFSYSQELKKMGAVLKRINQTLLISGVPSLKGAEVYAKDLRGGAALVCAGLGASGITEVKNIEYIDRGYEKLEDALTLLGAKITRN